MHGNQQGDLSRRTFLKASVTTAAAAGLPLSAQAGESQTKESKPSGALPRRVLGRTGEKVTILNLGTAPKADRRLLNAAYDAGVRYIDTADCYAQGASEQLVGDWLSQTGRRKEFFIVTKDHPKTPDEWVTMVDTRLEVLKTDVIDLFFIHGLGAGYQGGGKDSDRDTPKSKEWAAAADKMKKSGKVRFVGFSTHTMLPLRIDLLNNAAAGGWVDAIMVAADPQVIRENADFHKALDACHKAGVGLICMKEMRGVQHAPKFMPEFEAKGLTPQQAVLHAIWSDGRFASICSAMPSLKILTENSLAAKSVKPMSKEDVGAVIGLYERYATTFCNGCDGSCQRAGKTRAALGDITRYLAYYEADGCLEEARRLFAALPPEQRDWRNADLIAASQACASKLDFARLLHRAEKALA